MTHLPITSLFVAAFALALIALSMSVSLHRIRIAVPVGDNGDETLRRRIRAQGNFIEYVPLALVALGLVEAHGAPAWLVLAIGALLAGGRLSHGIGMLGGSTPLRGIGMMLTYLALAVAAGRLIADALG